MQLQKNIPVPLLQNRPLLKAICPDSLWARDNRWLLSRVQRLAGPAGGHGPFVPVGGTNREQRPLFCPGWWLQPGEKARVAFVPVGSINRDKRPLFCPGWYLQPGQNSLAPLSPSLPPPPEPFSSLVLAVLGSGERSSCSFLHHICEDL